VVAEALFSILFNGTLEILLDICNFAIDQDLPWLKFLK
jgi:hypothetical protein